MSTLSRKKLDNLYSSGKSMAEIAKLLQCSVHKIKYWMQHHGIMRRSISEAMYLKLNPNGNPFKIKTNLTDREKILLGLGIGIYWGEGEKVSKNAIRVANTNPALLRTFISFLLQTCGLEYRKLTFSIVCFNDTDPEVAKEYWTKELETREGKFGKIVQIPPQGKGTYKRKSQYGVCTIAVSNSKLKTWIMNQIAKYT